MTTSKRVAPGEHPAQGERTPNCTIYRVKSGTHDGARRNYSFVLLVEVMYRGKLADAALIQQGLELGEDFAVAVMSHGDYMPVAYTTNPDVVWRQVRRFLTVAERVTPGRVMLLTSLSNRARARLSRCAPGGSPEVEPS